MIAYIYRIRDLVNDKFYIGSTRQKDPRSRWTTGHLRDLRNQKHDNQRLQHSWNKHGEDSFMFEVIDTFEYQTEKDIEIREQEWIDRLNPQYNIARQVIRNESMVAKAAEVNSKEYFLTNPEGVEIKVKNLRRFSMENGLNDTCLWAVAVGRAVQHRGWLCRFGTMSAEIFETIRKKARIPVPKRIK